MLITIVRSFAKERAHLEEIQGEEEDGHEDKVYDRSAKVLQIAQSRRGSNVVAHAKQRENIDCDERCSQLQDSSPWIIHAFKYGDTHHADDRCD